MRSIQVATPWCRSTCWNEERNPLLTLRVSYCDHCHPPIVAINTTLTSTGGGGWWLPPRVQSFLNSYKQTSANITIKSSPFSLLSSTPSGASPYPQEGPAQSQLRLRSFLRSYTLPWAKNTREKNERSPRFVPDSIFLRFNLPTFLPLPRS